MILTDEEKDKMLADLNEMHNPDEVEDLFGEFPDSVYQVRLDKIYFYKAKTKPKLVIEFEIVPSKLLSPFPVDLLSSRVAYFWS